MSPASYGILGEVILKVIGGGMFEVAVPFSIRLPEDGYTEVIPVGTITDGASSYLLNGHINLLPITAQINGAAIWHDTVYRRGFLDFGAGVQLNGKLARKYADSGFADLLRLSNVDLVTSARAYRALRLFGALAWNAHRKRQNITKLS